MQIRAENNTSVVNHTMYKGVKTTIRLEIINKQPLIIRSEIGP